MAIHLICIVCDIPFYSLPAVGLWGGVGGTTKASPKVVSTLTVENEATGWMEEEALEDGVDPMWGMTTLKIERLQNDESISNHGGESVSGEVEDGVTSMGSPQPPHLLSFSQQGNSSGTSMEDTSTVACTGTTDEGDDIWHFEFSEHSLLTDYIML